MTRIDRSLVCALVAAGLCGPACSSMEKLADAGTGTGGETGSGGGAGALSGTGGAAAGPDTHCIDGSDGCVWSCGAGRETGSGDSPQPYCDADGKFRCPVGSQALSTCPPGSCAGFDTPLCCEAATGRLRAPPCKADGFRDVCPAGSSPAQNYRCIPDGIQVTQCLQLEGQPCASTDLACRDGASCRCIPNGATSLVWQCEVVIP